jgi:hypothetical protein
MYDVGPCPICGQGLLGVRICCGTPVILCDECDAAWASPELSERLSTTTDPVCRLCGVSLWGDQALWATREQIVAAGWWPQVRQSAAVDRTFSAADDGRVAHPTTIASPATPGRLGAIYRGTVFVLLLFGAAVAALAVL